MKLENAIAAINKALEPELKRQNVDYLLDGLAVPYFEQSTTNAPASFGNRYIDGAGPAAPNDARDVHIFHITRGSEFLPSDFTRPGRQQSQAERPVIVLIGYTIYPQLVDYVKHVLAGHNGVELRLLELAGDLINEKYLGLEKQVNADYNPRQLFAITYALKAEPLGGPACPQFLFAK